MKKARKKQPTALLIIGNKEAVDAAARAITGILSLPNLAAETATEAMRTLAVIAQPPSNTSITGCVFTSK